MDGTTGYEFTASAIGVTVDRARKRAFTDFYREFTGDDASVQAHVYESKQRILMDSLASEVNMLARRLERIAAAQRQWRDFTLVSLTRALIEIMAAFPVYRTYLRAGARQPRKTCGRCHARGAAGAAPRGAGARCQRLRVHSGNLALEQREPRGRASAEHERFALRFQQLTGPGDGQVRRGHGVLSLPPPDRPERGGRRIPAAFGISLERFHAQYAERLRSWPLSMVTTSTHDTKRGEDAAALPRRAHGDAGRVASGRARVGRRSRRNTRSRSGDAQRPSRRDEYMFYQALVGAWPFGWDGEQGAPQFIAAHAGLHAKGDARGQGQRRPGRRPTPRTTKASLAS